MNIEIFKIDNKSFDILLNDSKAVSKNEGTIYLHVIECSQRTDAVNYIKKYVSDQNILDYLLEPEKHLRFELFNEVAYGEIAYFSANIIDNISYIGVLGYSNKIFIIKDKAIRIIECLQDSFLKVINYNTLVLDSKFIIYLLFVEVITNLSKEIFIYRDKIEVFSREFSKTSILTPETILKAKTQVSDFARVAENLFFTLYFPPIRTILDHESPYRKYFEELLKSVELLKGSIRQAEERLDRLHEHLLLLLQEKSNRKINFLTIIQSIFVPLTLIVGVYGMNFSNMPELNYKYSYFIALGAMGIIALGFLRFFYKHKWFE